MLLVFLYFTFFTRQGLGDAIGEQGSGVGHGRNSIALGPDGYIYLAHGNDVKLPKDFFLHIQPIIDFHESEFEKNTALMNDYFLFNIELPGKMQQHNGDNEEGILSWEIDFNEIATDNFEMYGKSIIIKKWRILLSIFLVLALPLYLSLIHI